MANVDPEPGHVTTSPETSTDWADPRTMWDHRYGQTELLWSAAPNALLAEEVGGLEPGRALDLGCGEGRNAIWLAENGWKVTAVDFSRVGIEKARRLAEDRGVSVTWVVDDLLSYRPETAAYGLAFLIFIHLRRADLFTVLRSASESLTADGTLIVVGHDASNLTEGVGGPQDTALLYTSDDILEALPALTPERAQTVQRQVQTPEGERMAIDVLVRLRRFL